MPRNRCYIFNNTLGWSMAIMTKKIELGLFLLGLGGIFIIIGIVLFSSGSFREAYSEKLDAPDVPEEVVLEQQTFSIKRLLVSQEGECGFIEIKRNGQALDYACDDTRIENRDLLSNERIARLFGSLTKEKFLELEDVYYAPGIENDITITLETNFGTKEITISSSNKDAPALTEELEEIIEVIEEVEEELEEPDPSPPPTPEPTPTPSPGSTPNPSSTPNPTPTPTASPDLSATPEPFRCDMLNNQNVTVSNIRCLDGI